MSKIFYPASTSFVKKNAKFLHQAVPGLRLQLAQEATACALGFSSWFDCIRRLEKGGTAPSLFDESVTEGERLYRKYMQIRALDDVANIPASDAEVFIRNWKLTAKAREPRLSGCNDRYHQLSRILTDIESGVAPPDEFEAVYNGVPPVRVAEGVILSWDERSSGYYTLSSQRLLDMPVHLRGNASEFLEYEDKPLLALAFPEVFPSASQEACLRDLGPHEPWIHEWQAGRLPDNSPYVSLKALVARAASEPAEWFAISLRWADKDLEIGKREQPMRFVAPALRGRDFVKFIESRGVLRGLPLQWFRFKSASSVSRIFMSTTTGGGGTGNETFNQVLSSEAVPVPPVFGSPFKHGPMRSLEFTPDLENGLPRLDQDMMDDAA